MNKRPDETQAEYLRRLATVAETLTSEQIAACMWVMGVSGWDATSIATELRISATDWERSSQ